MFRKNWHYDPSLQDSTAFLEHVEEVLDEMDRLVKAGKMRYLACLMKAPGHFCLAERRKGTKSYGC